MARGRANTLTFEIPSGGSVHKCSGRQIEEHRAYVTELKQSAFEPSLTVALKLAEYFGCHVDDILRYEPDLKKE